MLFFALLVTVIARLSMETRLCLRLRLDVARLVLIAVLADGFHERANLAFVVARIGGEQVDLTRSKLVSTLVILALKDILASTCALIFAETLDSFFDFFQVVLMLQI